MRVGVLTGGGDCPGLNAVIRAIVRAGVTRSTGIEFVGLPRRLARAAGGRHRCPWTCRRYAASCRAAARSWARRGPTRWPRARRPAAGPAWSGSRTTWPSLGVDALVAIGGEDTLGRGARLHEEGVQVVGVPKTIDNDLGATDYTFGFDTAVNIAMEAIDRLHTTAESHHRALIVEVMGRHAGWIALHAGHGRRRQRDPDPGAAVRHRAGLRVGASTGSRPGTRRSWWSPRARTPRTGPTRWPTQRAGRVRPRPAAAASARCWPTRSRSAPARRPAPRCSATSSAAAPRPRSTGCWPPGSARTRSARWPTARSA